MNVSPRPSGALTHSAPSGALTYSALLPHPPIIVPEVAGPRLASCRATYEACLELARRVVASKPSRLVLVSPHSPRQGDAFGLWGGDRLRGDLGRFGAADTTVDLENDLPWLDALRRGVEMAGLRHWTIPPQPLDHGAVVPLWFLADAGWRGATAVLSLPERPRTSTCLDFGRAIGACLDRPTALIASGDMSHRCTPEAPAGFHPRAAVFDRELTALIAGGRFDAIPHLDPAWRRAAAEDTIDSTLIVSAAHGDLSPGETKVLSYEHPFGVGYLVASLYGGPA